MWEPHTVIEPLECRCQLCLAGALNPTNWQEQWSMKVCVNVYTSRALRIGIRTAFIHSARSTSPDPFMKARLSHPPTINWEAYGESTACPPKNPHKANQNHSKTQRNSPLTSDTHWQMGRDRVQPPWKWYSYTSASLHQVTCGIRQLWIVFHEFMTRWVNIWHQKEAGQKLNCSFDTTSKKIQAENNKV